MIAKPEWFKVFGNKPVVPPGGSINPFLVGKMVFGFAVDVMAELESDRAEFIRRAALRIWSGGAMFAQIPVSAIPGIGKGMAAILQPSLVIAEDTTIAMQVDGSFVPKGKLTVVLEGMFGDNRIGGRW